MLPYLNNKFWELVIIIGSLFLFFTLNSHAQTNCKYTFRGSVYDIHEDSPLVDARVELLNEQRIIFSSEQGEFNIAELCPGIYKLQITHPSCEPLVRNIQIPQKKIGAFKLEHHVNALAEIFVEEDIRNKAGKNQLESTLDQVVLLQNQSSDLGSILSQLSGVSMMQTGSSLSKPVIHGMFGSRVGIVIDGIRLQDQEWGADHAPTLDINSSDFISVVKGAGLLRYGGDTPGGIILLQKNKIAFQDTLTSRLGTSLQTNGRGGGLFAKTQWSNGLGSYAQLNLTAKQLGDLKAPAYNLSNTASVEKAFSMTFGRNTIQSGWEASYRFYDTQLSILRSAHVGTPGDLARAIESDVPLVIKPFTYTLGAPRQENQHHNGKLSYFRRFNEFSKWEINYNVQWNHRQEYDVRRGDLKDVPAIDLQLWTQDLEVYLRTKIGENYKLTGGLSGKAQDNYSDPVTKVKRLIPDYDKYHWAAFSALEFEPNNLWNIEFGLRWETINYLAQKYYDQNDWLEKGYVIDFPETPIVDYGTQLLTTLKKNFSTLSSSFGMAYQAVPSHTLLFNFNHSERAPNPSELFSDGLHHSLATIEYGELRLSKEKVNKWLLGVESRGDQISYSASIHYADLKDYIIIEPEGFEARRGSSFPVWQYRSIDGFLTGLDIDMDWLIQTNLHYQMNSSWLRGHDSSRDRPLIDIPPYNFQHNLTWTPPSKKNWEVSVQHQYSAYQNRFPDNNFDFSLLVEGDLVDTPIDVSTPPQAYHLWQATLAYSSKNKADKSWDFRIIVENLTNTSYRNYLNRLRYYADEMGRNVQVQINYNF